MDSVRTIKLRIKDRELCSSLLSDVLHPSVHMKNMLIILYNGVDIDLKPYFLKAESSSERPASYFGDKLSYI